MNDHWQELYFYDREPLASKVSRLVFFLYILYVLVGGPAPFQDEAINVNDIRSSSISNQIFDSILPLLSLFCLWPKRRQLFQLLYTEKYLTLFLLWCLCSVFWSDFPLDSFKRWGRVVGSTIVVLGFLLNSRTPDEALKYLKIAFSLYIPVSLMAVVFVPGATQWEFPAWRGLASHKNTLGQITLISVLVWLFAISQQTAKAKLHHWLLFFTSLILLLGSKSTTTFACLLLLMVVALWLTAEKHLQELQIGRLPSLTMICCLPLLYLLFQALELNVLQEATRVFGKDLSFTGRTDLWEEIFHETRSHLYLGCGFGGFWVVQNPAVLSLYADYRFPWLPNEAHQGYLDLLNETGVVGIILLLLLIFCYFKNLTRLERPHFWKWFFICALFINLQESTLFRSASLSGWSFLLSYLALYVELLNQKYISQTMTKQDCPIPLNSIQLNQYGTLSG